LGKLDRSLSDVLHPGKIFKLACFLSQMLIAIDEKEVGYSLGYNQVLDVAPFIVNDEAYLQVVGGVEAAIQGKIGTLPIIPSGINGFEVVCKAINSVLDGGDTQ
jgi:hypothetical protein